MNKLKHTTCIFLLLVLFLSFATPAFAASAKNATAGGSGKNATVMTVTTQKATTLTFKQTKGKISYSNWSLGTSTLSTYGDFFIYVKDKSGKDGTKSYDCRFKSSVSIPLKANKTYEITIMPRAKAMTFRALIDAGKLKNRGRWITTFTWKTIPTWTVTAKKVFSLKVTKVTAAPQQ